MDQLSVEMRGGQAFTEFAEPPLRFRPTSTFKSGCVEYRQSRAPSWSDRVLYSRTPRIVPLLYRSCLDLSSSNHLPVMACFMTSLPLAVRMGLRPRGSGAEHEVGRTRSEVCAVS